MDSSLVRAAAATSRASNSVLSLAFRAGILTVLRSCSVRWSASVSVACLTENWVLARVQKGRARGFGDRLTHASRILSGLQEGQEMPSYGTPCAVLDLALRW